MSLIYFEVLIRNIDFMNITAMSFYKQSIKIDNIKDSACRYFIIGHHSKCLKFRFFFLEIKILPSRLAVTSKYWPFFQLL